MKIAIVRLSALGDIVFSLVAAALIKQKYSDADITWIVDERFKEVVKNSPFVDSVVTIGLKPFGIGALLDAKAKLKSLGGFDMVLDLQGLIKSAIVTAMTDSPKKIGFSFKSAREGLASLFYTDRVKSDYQKNIVERYLDLLNVAFGGGFSLDDVYGKPSLLGFSAVCRYIKPDRKNILINMSASKQNKIYPSERMQKVIAAFDGENVMVLGGESANLPQMGLDEIKALISSCDLVIGGDTGITHMAWAMNVPSITIFGATPHERNAFATNKNVMIGAKDGVDAKKLDYSDFAIKDIEPHAIIEAARRVM